MKHLNEFLIYIYKIKMYSQNTIDAYKIDLNQFINFLTKELMISIIDLNKISKKEIKSYLLFLSERNLSEKSINRKLASIKSFFRYLLKQKLVKSNPTTNINGLKIPQKLPRFIQNDVLFKVLEHNINDDWKIIRDKTILELFFSTGIRLRELIFLDLKDLEMEDKILKVVGKGNKERIVPFGKKVFESLVKYLIFSPASHKTAIPLNPIKIDVPKSGWLITSIIGKIKIVNTIKTLTNEFTLSIWIRWKYFAKQAIMAIFISSDGWRFIKYKLIHLCEPWAVMPYKEAQIKDKNTIK